MVFGFAFHIIVPFVMFLPARVIYSFVHERNTCECVCAQNSVDWEIFAVNFRQHPLPAKIKHEIYCAHNTYIYRLVRKPGDEI